MTFRYQIYFLFLTLYIIFFIMSEIKILGETKLIYGGFIYVRSKLPVNGKTYWECQKLRRKECKARTITAFDITENKTYFVRQPTLEDHEHVPNQEECQAEIVKYSLKRKAEDQPQQPPAQILRTELAGLSDGVLSQLPERDNLKKSMRKVRRYFIILLFYYFIINHLCILQGKICRQIRNHFLTWALFPIAIKRRSPVINF